LRPGTHQPPCRDHIQNFTSGPPLIFRPQPGQTHPTLPKVGIGYIRQIPARGGAARRWLGDDPTLPIAQKPG
jgi:hypothetical protein